MECEEALRITFFSSPDGHPGSKSHYSRRQLVTLLGKIKPTTMWLLGNAKVSK